MAEHRWPQPNQQPGEDQGDQQRRPARQQPFQDYADDDCCQSQHERGFIHRIEVLQQHQKAVQCGGLAGQVQPQQVGHLTDGNYHGGAEGEAQYHRVRDKIHQRAEPQQTQ
ncbi:hypothetical protein D3C84_866400 [compost metagenome]